MGIGELKVARNSDMKLISYADKYRLHPITERNRLWVRRVLAQTTENRPDDRS